MDDARRDLALADGAAARRVRRQRRRVRTLLGLNALVAVAFVVAALILARDDDWTHGLEGRLEAAVASYERLGPCLREAHRSASFEEQAAWSRLDVLAATASGVPPGPLLACGEAFRADVRAALPEAASRWHALRGLHHVLDSDVRYYAAAPCRTTVLAAHLFARLAHALGRPVEPPAFDCPAPTVDALARAARLPEVLRRGQASWPLTVVVATDREVLEVAFRPTVTASGQWPLFTLGPTQARLLHGRTTDGVTWELLAHPEVGTGPEALAWDGDRAWAVACPSATAPCRVLRHDQRRAAGSERLFDDGRTTLWPATGWETAAELPDGMRPSGFVAGTRAPTVLGQLEGGLVAVPVADGRGAAPPIPLGPTPPDAVSSSWIVGDDDGFVRVEVGDDGEGRAILNGCRVASGGGCDPDGLAFDGVPDGSASPCSHDRTMWIVVAGVHVALSDDGGARWRHVATLAERARPSGCTDGLLALSDLRDHLTLCTPAACDLTHRSPADARLVQDRSGEPGLLRLDLRTGFVTHVALRGDAQLVTRVTALEAADPTSTLGVWKVDGIWRGRTRW